MIVVPSPHNLVRASLLRVSENRRARTRITRSRVVRRMAARFMPGEHVEDALNAAAAMAQDRISSLLTFLGEDVSDASEALANGQRYIAALATIAERNLPAHVSVKPTQLGLGCDDRALRESLHAIAAAARTRHRLVWIDMEGSAWTDATLALYREVRERHHNVGLAIQAYLHRTPDDLMSLLPLKPLVRLVKGAYQEPASIALQSRDEVSAAYRQLALKLIDEASNGVPPPVLATHDLDLVYRILDESGKTPTSFEVAMLYGIRNDDLRRLAAEGYKTSVLISYGTEWAAWFMRRLAERPANLAFGLTALARR